jgi:hypothetical protein
MFLQPHRIKPGHLLIPCFLAFALAACQKDEDTPLPDPNRYYVNMYNFLMEAYDVQWNINGLDVEPAQAYGIPLFSFFPLEDSGENITIRVLEAGSSQILQSDSCTVEQNNYYMASLMGSGDDPLLTCEPMDLRAPSLGKVKLRMMHTAGHLGPIDLYVGGSAPENKLITGVGYGEVSAYVETTEEQLWESLIITPSNVSPADTTLLSFIANEGFISGRIYLGVVGSKTNSPSSDLQFFLYDQPLGF